MNPKTQAELQSQADRIIAGLESFLDNPESGKLPWTRPWTPNGVDPFPANPTTGNKYRGMNTLILWMASYGDPRWMGFNQAKKHLGYTRRGRFWKWTGKGDDPKFGVRKGEKGTKIFRPRMVSDDSLPNGQRCVGFATATVFNATQIEGFPALVTQDIADIDPSEGFAKASEVLGAWPVPVTHGGNQAYYMPLADRIQLPEPGQFQDVSLYWSTRGHEVIHSTGHSSRLDRLGNLSYAEEELVAEIGSVFLCAALGIDRPTLSDNHFKYVAGWIRRIKDDPNTIRHASNRAFKAMEMVLENGGLE